MRFVNCLITTFTLLLLSVSLVAAQTGQLRGHIVLKQTDGSTLPGADAVVDVYRVDNKPAEYNTNSDKEGKFTFAGLPYKGTYIIAVSMPGAQPAFQPDVNVGRGVDYELVLSPGDGRRLNLSDIAKMRMRASQPRPGNEAVQSTGVTSKYDRFRDETTVSTIVLISKPRDARFEELGPFSSLYAGFVFSGQAKVGSPAVISFGFIVKEFEGDRRILPQRFSNPTEFIILYDGQRYKSAMNASRVRDAVGYVSDIVSDQIPPSTFGSIVTAQRVEIRVGGNELDLTEGHLKALRELLRISVQ